MMHQVAVATVAVVAAATTHPRHSLSSSASDLGGDSGSLYFSRYFCRSVLDSSFILLYFSVLPFSMRLASAAFSLSLNEEVP